MDGDTISIFFYLPATDSLGHQHVDGKLRLLEKNVVLQFKVRDRVFKRAGEGLEKIEFPYREIEKVEYLGGWFRKKLLLKTRDPATLEKMPGTDLGRVVMDIARKSRKQAKKIEAFVDYRQSLELAAESHERWERSHGESGL